MAAKFGASETGNEALADDAEQGERLGGVHAIFYPPAIAVLKRAGVGGLGIKDGIKQAGRKGKVLVRQRIIARFDPSRPSQQAHNQLKQLNLLALAGDWFSDCITRL